MAVVTDREFGCELCKVLHLDPKKTRDIIIENKIEDVVMVKVTQYLQKEEGDELLLVLKKYNLIPVEEENPQSTDFNNDSDKTWPSYKKNL